MGQPNVDSMLRGITAQQLMEWRVYADMEPFDEVRMDIRFALLMQQLANIFRGKKRAPWPLKKFLDLFAFGSDPAKASAPKQSWQAQKSFAKMFTALHNAGRSE